MINLIVNEIILLHEKLLNKTGGMSGIRDFGMLESAVYSVEWILVLLMTLKLNHIIIQYTQQELILLGLSIADGTLNYLEILDWIKSHSK